MGAKLLNCAFQQPVEAVQFVVEMFEANGVGGHRCTLYLANEANLQRHLNYIHFNPVEHGSYLVRICGNGRVFTSGCGRINIQWMEFAFVMGDSLGCQVLRR